MRTLFLEGWGNFKEGFRWFICNGLVVLVLLTFTCFVGVLSALLVTVHNFKVDNSMLHLEVKNLRSDLHSGRIDSPTTSEVIETTQVSQKNKHVFPKSVCGESLEDALGYVNEYKDVAKEEEGLYGIPACITLAQGLLESRVGKSLLTVKGNNHFGVKCQSNSCKKGHCLNYSDDHHKDYFRTYKTAWESYRGHSKVLKNKRYKRLFKLDKKDYKGWAKGLKACGYATDPNYANKLIKIIEGLQLWKI